jgi:hypothetical protein
MAKFPLGQIVITPTAQKALSQSDVNTALARHLNGDWGDVDEHDRKENELSLTQSLRLFSVYHAANGTKFWIITEADRSATTILLPEDY